MANDITNLVDSLSRDEVLQLAFQYDLLERDGSIGNVALRKHAQNIKEKWGCSSVNIVSIMRDIAFECWKKLAINRWY